MSQCSWPECREMAVHNGYCQSHHNEYMRDWRLARKPIYSIDRQYAEELAGQPLTEEQIETFAEAIGNSSVPDALREILSTITNQEAT